METAIIISLIMAVVSAFAAKKSGASDAEALAAGAIGGLGTYYVATETEWGKSVIGDLDGTTAEVIDPATGAAVTNEDGSVATAPVGATVVKDEAGNIKYDSLGNAMFSLGGKVVSTSGDVLKSWGATGTAAVIGTAALASSGDTKKYLLWGGLALGAFLILR